jgi:para-aminobenzoate synthetase component 1
MQQIEITADELISALLALSATESVCLLDSCGVNHLGSHLLIAGIEPTSVDEVSIESEPQSTLDRLDDLLTKDLASVFTISYDFKKRLPNIGPSKSDAAEPDLFIAQFDTLIIHDYHTGVTTLAGNAGRFESVTNKLLSHIGEIKDEQPDETCEVSSNFSKGEYLEAIEMIKEQIRDGNTYQTNLTQQLSARLPIGLTPKLIFDNLRRDHPAAFAAFIRRSHSTVVSASPERFFSIDASTHKITTSPIKGTRPRGKTTDEDAALRHDLLTSEKDRAENIMIVDLLRNDIGRVCEFGSVKVEKLCDLEEHPSLFHLVSTISGHLRSDVKLSDVLKAVFPCGSITGAPKISTMRIIDEIEAAPRGLSMGAIGYYVPPAVFGLDETLDLSVAIRTMVIRDGIATFNVGGGITIDSHPASEYEETLTKARALMAAINGKLVADARTK